ncbi:hypothetical protein COOONC_16968 [Cooperia oncophora]
MTTTQFLVIGIPVAERKTDYIISTLSSLFGKLDGLSQRNLNVTERNYRREILFLVMFATMQISSTFVRNKTAEIQEKFASEITSGMLQVCDIFMPLDIFASNFCFFDFLLVLIHEKYHD